MALLKLHVSPIWFVLTSSLWKLDVKMDVGILILMFIKIRNQSPWICWNSPSSKLILFHEQTPSQRHISILWQFESSLPDCYIISTVTMNGIIHKLNTISLSVMILIWIFFFTSFMRSCYMTIATSHTSAIPNTCGPRTDLTTIIHFILENAIMFPL